MKLKKNIMATAKTKSSARKIITATIALTGAVFLQGCVTTDELYAQYDVHACRVALVQASSGKTLVQDIASDRTMTWEPAVYFETNKSDIKAQGKLHLDTDIKVLKTYRELRVSVRGFADAVGDIQSNRALSKKRTESVVDYLVAGGIARSRIEDFALGEDMPLIDTADEQALPVNRRVELFLMDINGNLVRYQQAEEPVRAAAHNGVKE